MAFFGCLYFVNKELVMNHIFIGVAAHKEYPIPTLDGYQPIQVGSANHKHLQGYVHDDAKEPNISKKNDNYSELTATYYIWKHVDADVKGLVHYRRYLGTKSLFDHKFRQDQILNKADVKRLLANSDVIVPKSRNYYIESNESHYVHAHHTEPLQELIKVLRSQYPEYVDAAEQVLSARRAHMFNMYIMKSEHYDQFCEWLFSVLSEVEKNVDIEHYDQQEVRVFGYLSELMTDMWIIANHLRVIEVDCLYPERQHLSKKIFLFLKRKFVGRGETHIKSSVDK
jgi:hypothetical protein